LSRISFSILTWSGKAFPVSFGSSESAMGSAG
jgi:hypothetical protein